MPEPPRHPPLIEGLRYAQVGTMLVAPMLVLGWIGHALDRKLGTQPWLLLAGLIVGMATGFVNFIRFVLSPPDGGAGPRPGER